ncbi:siderophore-interacting protein [Aquabacter spiritensis]|uniref:NADPH-dependent ferric siderophore reductase n=1 Tax=Aquabacter spiritensis TaxID=933073 RepID=A0A4R3LXU0_9HYPH|nr:siderophore-interacting protein [Aquabacter spiritensis]TCT05474.1 NADPH-dependent ferric siderophore reductase [Aquabacter spiritensis]
MNAPLRASARIPLADPAGMLDTLRARFAPHARLTALDGGGAVLEGRLGRVELRPEPGSLLVRVAGGSEAQLSVLKMAVAEHVAGCAGTDLPSFAWQGHDAGRRDIPYFREMTVVDAATITPRMRRVVLAGDAAHFATGGLHVRVLIPPAGRPPVWPHCASDGRTVWPSGADGLTPRVYTVRAVDPDRGELAIDVVLHAGTAPGSDWARTVRPGARVGLLGPGGALPEAADWVLFAGDETALPAIARMLPLLPATAQAVVRIEVADAAEEQPLASPARLDLRWLHRGGAPAGTTDLLLRAVAALDWPADRAAASAWIGCEQAAARALRARLAQEGLLRTRQTVAAYWRLGHQGVDLAA